MKSILSVTNLQAGYGDKPVLENINIEVYKGEIIALVGHNGAGKTTLLKTIYGQITPTSGNIEVKGKAVYVAQGVRVFPNLTVKENVLLVAKDEVIPAHIFELFPALKQLENNQAGNLSGGEQQMVAIARAVIQRPDILLFDEPSLGLSPKLVKEVFNKLDLIRKKYGYTIIIIEHNLNSLSAILNRAYLLEKGRIKKEIIDLKALHQEILS